MPGLDKALLKCNDPVIASCTGRRLTTKTLNDVKAKLDRATGACQKAMDSFRDDFDDQDKVSKYFKHADKSTYKHFIYSVFKELQQQVVKYLCDYL